MASYLSINVCYQFIGAGVDGQLGNGQLVDIPVPERIASLQELDVRAVACGFDFSMCPYSCLFIIVPG